MEEVTKKFDQDKLGDIVNGEFTGLITGLE